MAFKFAHLVGLGAKAEDDDKKHPEDDEQKAQDEQDEDEKDKSSKKVEDQDDEDSEDDDKKASDDGDDKDDNEDKEDAKKARASEKRRCAAIFASKYTASNVAMAAHLAFETSMSATEAINVLKMSALGSPQKTMLDQRMQGIPNPKVGADVPVKTGSAATDIAHQMMNVYNQVKGKK